MGPRRTTHAGWEILVLQPTAVPPGQSRLAVHHDPLSAGRFCHFGAGFLAALASPRTSAQQADARITERLRNWWEATGARGSFPAVDQEAIARLRHGLRGR